MDIPEGIDNGSSSIAALDIVSISDNIACMGEMSWKVGSLVWLAGKFSNRYSTRGIIEEIRGDRFGVRIENGDFFWANSLQLQPRAY